MGLSEVGRGNEIANDDRAPSMISPKGRAEVYGGEHPHGHDDDSSFVFIYSYNRTTSMYYILMLYKFNPGTY